MKGLQPVAESSEAIRVRLAAERTLLAWIRTSLALFGIGLLMARFLLTDEPGSAFAGHQDHLGSAAVSRILGIAFVLIGSVLTSAAAWRYRELLRDMAQGVRLPPGATIPLVASTLVSALGLAMSLCLVFLAA